MRAVRRKGLLRAGIVLAGVGLTLPSAGPAQAAGNADRYGYCNINPNPVTISGSEGDNAGSVEFGLACHDMQPTTAYTFSSSLTGATSSAKGSAGCKTAGPGAATTLKSDQFGFVSQFWTGTACTPGRFTVSVAPPGGRAAVIYGLLVPSH
jgi:hypothetical protein